MNQVQVCVWVMDWTGTKCGKDGAKAGWLGALLCPEHLPLWVPEDPRATVQTPIEPFKGECVICEEKIPTDQEFCKGCAGMQRAFG